ncbi:hypothetical protein SNE40_003508 [Patella caerulea]|uniref:HAT C-terminal dimerisation domain-containing protein n=1 Tax=Patella caerulea TaxID=87958 RepID=A0AAN8K9Y9_PATCE
MITAFFKRKNSENTDSQECEENNENLVQSPIKKIKSIIPQPQASVKTVKKWMHDMNIDIGYKVKQNYDGTNTDIVCEMWCTVCKEYSSDRNSSLVTGSKRVKKESVQQHKKSTSHDRAFQTKVAIDITKNKKDQLPPIETAFKKLGEDELIKMDKLFRTAYYLVKKERPFSDFRDLVELQNFNDANIGQGYCNDKAVKNFVSVIADGYSEGLKELLTQADFFSIFCDGSTDRTEVEKELIMVKVLENFYPKIKYVKLEQPPTTKATGILEAINTAFESLGVPNYKQKLIGFCSDGANVMMGQRRGVISLLKEEADADYIVSVWCLAHRLELAVKDAFSNSYMNNIIECLQNVYHFYQGSAKRNKEATDIAEIIDEHFSKPTKANGTRWVEHKLRAVTKLLNSWEVILTHMSNYASGNTNKGEDRAKTQGYIKKLTQFKFIWYLYFIKDVLSEVSRVSLLFQRDDIDVSSAVTKIKSTQISLQQMIDNPGAQLQSFNNDVSGNSYKGQTLLSVVDLDVLEDQKNGILNKIIDCFQSRFEDISGGKSVFTAAQIFDHKNWPAENDLPALYHYGNLDLNYIIQHFQHVLQNICNTDSVITEWSDLKLYVARNTHFRAYHPLAVWQRVSQEDVNNNYSNIMKVIHLTSCFPLSNASCERGFSTMKRIKSDWRCRLSNSTVDMLMRIDLEGPPLNDFNPRPFVNKWWLNGQRSKRPNSVPFGNRQ